MLGQPSFPAVDQLLGAGFDHVMVLGPSVRKYAIDIGKAESQMTRLLSIPPPVKPSQYIRVEYVLVVIEGSATSYFRTVLYLISTGKALSAPAL